VARKARVEFAGALYHLLDRGDRREEIFRDEIDRNRFLHTLGQACARTGWRVHAYVLMGNHYHLLVETPEPNLVAGMRWFQTTWTIRFNRRHRLSGHLLQGRYKAVVVDPQEGDHFVTLSDYIHLNPVRAGLVRLEDRLYDYRWSSYPAYVAAGGRASWFEPRRVLGELGLEDNAAGRRRYAERMRRRAVECRSESAELERLRSSWCLGSASFRERILGLMEAAGERIRHGKVDGAIRRSHSRKEAERLLELGLEHFQLTPEALAGLRKNDARKRALARAIRGRTAVENKWIAQSLHLGHASAVSRCLHRDKLDEQLDASLAKELE